MLKIMAAGIVFLLIGLATAIVYGKSNWNSYSSELLLKLESTRKPIWVKTFSEAELADLPAPVQRFFSRSLKIGQPVISDVNVEHTGIFNMSESGENWRSFSSRQKVITNRPGFDWEAEILMMPGMAVGVHDSYLAGVGQLRASIWGLIDLVNQSGTPELAEGELMRFFAETAWYPTALLPSQGIRWEPLTENSAKATLQDGEIEIPLLFTFNDDGLIASVRSECRPRTMGDKLVEMPWEGKFSNYEKRDGMMIPIDSEVAWITPDGAKPYFKGKIKTVRFEFAE